MRVCLCTFLCNLDVQFGFLLWNRSILSIASRPSIPVLCHSIWCLYFDLVGYKMSTDFCRFLFHALVSVYISDFVYEIRVQFVVDCFYLIRKFVPLLWTTTFTVCTHTKRPSIFVSFIYYSSNVVSSKLRLWVGKRTINSNKILHKIIKRSSKDEKFDEYEIKMGEKNK